MIKAVNSYMAKPCRIYEEKDQKILHSIDILPTQTLMESSIFANLL
jgi:hypothetical protein